MLLFIEPVDVWFFRDGRSFNAHEDHRAESFFPPYPTVMQGIIRSHQLVLQGVDLRDQKAIAQAIGTATDYGKLRLRGPFLARREAGKLQYYFPQPADAVTVDKDKRIIGTLIPQPNYFPQPADAVTVDKDKRIIRTLIPQPMPKNVCCSAPTPMLLWDDDPKKGIGGLWLREDRLRAYLQGAEEVEGTPSSELFMYESRVGIGLDHERHTTRDEALYEVQYVRPCQDVGLVVEVDGYERWPETVMLRMGGEGRGGVGAAVSAAKKPTPPTPPKIPASKRFKLYFATPTYFTEGWQPSDWGRFFEGKVTLQAAALRGYESIGGYDMAKRHHKSARRYVPAGSVYYFESQTTAQLSRNLTLQAVTDWGAEIGFGQVIIEGW